MYSKGLDTVYLKATPEGISHSFLSGKDLFLIDPLSDFAFFNYEAGFSSFDQFYEGDREKIDLVMIDKETNKDLIGLEIKLTAIPDSSTRKYDEDHYGCEMVVRPPTICFIGCTICNCFLGKEGRQTLKDLLGDIRQINHWEEIDAVLPYYGEILAALTRVSDYLADRQTPIIVQPVWKTIGTKPILADDCLDVFVWSNLAILKLCMMQGADKKSLRRKRTADMAHNALSPTLPPPYQQMGNQKHHSGGRPEHAESRAKIRCSYCQ